VAHTYRGMQPTDDSALLRQYAENNSDEAFAALVTRHINLVYSVALRQVGNPHQAEEITQAVFIILAKKAAQLRHDQALSSWLFQATRLTANNFVRSEARRHRREEEAYMQSVLDEAGTEVWPRIAPLLDTAVADLREKDRRAIVLRFYEGRNLREVGLALGASEDAAEKRVSRALEKLRNFFAKRGVSSTTAILAGAVAAHSVQAAPAVLAKSVTAVAMAKGTVASISTLTLVKGTLKIMTCAKLKLAIGITAGILLAGGAVTVAISQTGSNNKLAAQAIIKASQDAYTALSSYSDSGKVIAEVGGQTVTTTFNIRLQRPNLYRVEWSQAVTPSFSTGGVVWSAGNGDFMLMKMAGQPSSKPRKEQDMQSALATATGVSGQASSTIPGTFFKQNWGNVLNPAGSTLQKQKDEPVGGLDCYVVSSSTGPIARQGKTVRNTTTTLWIGKQDHLIHQTQMMMEGASFALPQTSDSKIKAMLEEHNEPATPEAVAAARGRMEAGIKQAQAMLKSGRFIFTQTHENISINEKFSPSDFAP